MYQTFLQELTSYQLSNILKITLFIQHHEVKKLIIRPILLKEQAMWQIESTQDKKTFHKNIHHNDLIAYLRDLASQYTFHQIILDTTTKMDHYRVSKKGKLLRYTQPHQAPKAPASLQHNRPKKYLLEEGMPIPALVDLGIFDHQFRIKANAQKKFRQINHFLALIVESMDFVENQTLTIIDFGCGKSYLSFIIYYYFVYIKDISLTMIGYDLKADVVETCNQTAQKYHYTHLHFIHGDIAKADHYQNIDAIITLHACNTATDYALHYAMKHQIKYIFSVPCCQHEINQQITPPQPLEFLFHHGLHKERLSALITDAIRCEILRSMGYSVDVVEFVEIENTPKNALIRAKLIHHTKTFMINSTLQSFLASFSLKPTLIRLLQADALHHDS